MPCNTEDWCHRKSNFGALHLSIINMIHCAIWMIIWRSSCHWIAGSMAPPRAVLWVSSKYYFISGDCNSWEHAGSSPGPGTPLRSRPRSFPVKEGRSWSRSTPEVVPGQGYLVPSVFPLPSHLFPGIAVTLSFQCILFSRLKIPY